MGLFKLLEQRTFGIVYWRKKIRQDTENAEQRRVNHLAQALRRSRGKVLPTIGAGIGIGEQVKSRSPQTRLSHRQ